MGIAFAIILLPQLCPDTMKTRIPHLNFQNQLVAISPNHYFQSNNTLLLCLDDDGFLLHHFFLTQEGVSGSSIVMQACVTLAKGIGASDLVRIQARPAYETDPFRVHSSSTKALYETAQRHNLHLTEVLLPRRT